jgi:hypothetical protein
MIINFAINLQFLSIKLMNFFYFLFNLKLNFHYFIIKYQGYFINIEDNFIQYYLRFIFIFKGLKIIIFL